MALTHSSGFANLICSCNRKEPPLSAAKRKIISVTIPARDRVIDFGKYKGKMLGSLPSTYLKWVSKNLRAGDSEQWAKLADQVLEDPVYLDRLEWEFVDRVLSGNKDMSWCRNESAVSQLLDISERFGWDNEDKIGWSKVNFELLGTSKGGRIPRTVSSPSGGVKEEKDFRAEKMREKDKILSEREIRRKQRRESAKLKKEQVEKDKLGTIRKNNDSLVSRIEEKDYEEIMEIKNQFPGRESLLKKVLNAKPYL